MNSPEVKAYEFSDNTIAHIPNNPLPALLYVGAVDFDTMLAPDLSAIAARNGWYLDWLESDAVYAYTHYHSTAHELLVVTHGTARVQLGGHNGKAVHVYRGDAIAIPAGVAHRRIRSSKDFAVAGLYPVGQKWDPLRLKPTKQYYEEAQKEIPAVPLPVCDPLYGPNGPMLSHWK